MSKVLQIGKKDLLIILYDRTSLLLMLLAPFVLILGLGLIAGGFKFGEDEGNTGIDIIPIAFTNLDEGALGAILADVFTTDDLADLIQMTEVTDVASAQQQVDDNKVAAAVIVPAGFSDGIMAGETAVSPAIIELYVNPANPIGASIVDSIVTQFINQLNGVVASVEVITAQMVQSDRLAPEQVGAFSAELGRDLEATSDSIVPLITLTSRNPSGAESEGVNALAVLAPGMAIVFLMYTVTIGARSILTEWDEGTMPRILTTPTTVNQILSGKMISIFLMGVVQVLLLVLVSSLLFGLNWGDPLAVFILIITVVAGAVGWGAILAAYAHSPSQITSMGSAMMLLFGILGGSFVDIQFAGVMNVISHLTPNAWATDGFNMLANGASFQELLPIYGALIVMSIILLAIASVLLRRRWIHGG